mmetsp:Transcript_13096/g.15132  ORF Transcript_13096/g.15132 Transcript_13096/m.15132 type:complete len:127 (+) Transcript_13096:250-630(+)
MMALTRNNFERFNTKDMLSRSEIEEQPYMYEEDCESIEGKSDSSSFHMNISSYRRSPSNILLDQEEQKKNILINESKIGQTRELRAGSFKSLHDFGDQNTDSNNVSRDGSHIYLNYPREKFAKEEK